MDLKIGKFWVLVLVILVLGIPVGAVKNNDLLSTSFQVGAGKMPVANNMTIQLLSNTNYTGKLNATNTKTYNIITKPMNGTLTLNKTSGKFVYTPNKKFTGNDRFTYNVNNGTRNSNTATVKITVITNTTPANGTKTIYVANNGTDRNDGLTPTKPKRNIQQAVDATKPGDTISLAPGTYKDTPITINKNITLIGGTQSNTIIDGQQVTSCIRIQPGITATITNLTIKNGKSDSSGGGISNDGILTLKTSTITDNGANHGGAIYNNGTMTITGVTIKNNSAHTSGGGIYSLGTLTIENSTITNNTAREIRGGGIYNDGVMTIMVGTIKNNSAAQNGGGIDNNGILTIEDSTITKNIAGNSGGGIFNTNLLYVYGSNITYNTAKSGGGIYNQNKAYVDAITIITRNKLNNIQGKPLIPA
jgi:predicted outer membrane repeat protein